MEFKGKTILLVEDEALIGLAQAEKLRQAGWEVIHTVRGEEAIDLVNRGKPVIELILMDIELSSGLDGTETARIIQKNHDIPVVFLSVHTTRDVVAKIEEITSYGFVVKGSGDAVLDASLKMAFRLHQANRQVRERERWLNSVLNSVPAGIIIVDAETRCILEANPAALVMFGAARNMVIGQVCHQFVCTAERNSCPICDLGQTADNSERMLLTSTGLKVPIVKTVVTERIAGRKCLVESFFSIAERKRMEDDIRANERKFRSLIEQLPLGVYRTTLSGKIIHANETLAHILGFATAQDLVQSNATEVYEDPAVREAQLQEWMKAGEVLKRELVFKRVDGRKIWVRDTGRVVREEGKSYIDGIIEDISEQKAAESELKYQKLRFEQLFYNSPDGIALLDSHAQVLEVNRSFTRIFGYENDQICGRSLDDILVPKTYQAEAKRRSREYIQDGLTLSQETQRMTKQGNLVDVRVITFPIRFQDGEISGIYIIYEDITAQKELEKQKMVARSLQGLDSLVDGLAHHFNNAFAVISGNAQLAASLLSKSAESGKVKKALVNIQAVIKRIQDIAKTNTRLARFSNTDQQRMIRIHINDFMREFLLTRSLPADGAVDIRQELLAEGDVFADKGQLWEIMDNLLDNALESMAGITPPRQIVMRTEMIQVAEGSSESVFLAPGRYVKISVQDSGRGIPSQIRGNIFQPFFTTKGNRQGLGLALSYFLLKQYNGHIDFDSPAGGGSRFSIYFPEFGYTKL